MQSLRDEQSLNPTSTRSWLMFVHPSLILPPPPSPSPVPTTFIPPAGPLARDVGPKYNSLASAEQTLPLPFLQGCGQLILFPRRIWGSMEELGTGKYQGGTYNVSGVVNNKDLRERVHDRHVTGMLEYERGGNLIRYASSTLTLASSSFSKSGGDTFFHLLSCHSTAATQTPLMQWEMQCIISYLALHPLLTTSNSYSTHCLHLHDNDNDVQIIQYQYQSHNKDLGSMRSTLCPLHSI